MSDQPGSSGSTGGGEGACQFPSALLGDAAGDSDRLQQLSEVSSIFIREGKKIHPTRSEVISQTP